MLTLFAIPKGFQGQFRNIQLNAIGSWTRLEPRPEIILLGDDPGTAEAAADLGARHVPMIERNDHGTPLASAIFATGQQYASNSIVCYVNSDIILMQDFMSMVAKVDSLFRGQEFLAVGRKTNIELTSLLDFGDPGWERRLRDAVAEQGHYVTYDSDFFVYRNGMFSGMPPFAIGRCFWTQWLMYDTIRRGIPMIDTTPVVTSVEPRHDYSHAHSTGGSKRLSGVEYESNRRLFRGCQYYTTVDSTHVLTPGALRPRPARTHLLSLLVRLDYFIYFLLKGTLYPYSLPLIVALRAVRSALERTRAASRALFHSEGKRSTSLSSGRSQAAR
jgi:hypothetical protein